MKIKILSILLREIRETVSSEQFKKIEDVIFDVAEMSGDPKTVGAALMLRIILDARD